MADNTLAATLTKIDPTQGLIEYVQSVKPYHSKLLDVQVEFVYRDLADGTAIDQHTMDIVETSPDIPIVYSDCGYGLAWDTDTTYAGVPFLIIDTVGRGVEANDNYFVIDVPDIQSATFFPFSLASNQFRLSTTYSVTSANVALGTLYVSTDLTSIVSPGGQVGFNVARVNGSIVSAVLDVVSVTSTTVVVSNTLPALLQYPGTLHVFVKSQDLPIWITRRNAVKVSATSGSLPSPLVNNGTYYVIPTNTPGTFNLSTKRYPTAYTDYVDLAAAGLGISTITRLEPFLAGDAVEVDDTYLNVNDGRYLIRDVQPVEGESAQWKIFVHDPIPYDSSEIGNASGRLFISSRGYDSDLECDVVAGPDLYTRGRAYDVIKFQFDMDFTSSADATAIENPGQGGFDATGYGEPDPWDVNLPNFDQITFDASAEFLTPSGFDTQYFDVSAYDTSTINTPNL